MSTPPLEKSARLCEEAPRDWVRASLGELLPLSYGKGLTAATRRTGEVPVYGSSGIVGWHDRALTSGPTVVLGRKGSAGAAFFSPGPCYPIDTVYFSEPAHVDGRLFTYLLNYLELGKLDQSTTIPSLSRERYDPIVVPVSGYNQQRRIVEKIDELFSQIEAGEQALARAQKLLERYRQSVLNAAVTGELTRDWRAQHKGELESGEALLQRILQARRKAWEQAEFTKMHARGKLPTDDGWKQRYKEPEPPDTIDLPQLPEGWVWARVSQLFDVQTGSTPKKGRPEYYEGGTIPWVTSAAVNEDYVRQASSYITERALAETNAKIIPRKSLLIAMYGEGKTRGKVTELEIDTATNQAIAALIPTIFPMLVTKFSKLYFKSRYEDFRKLASGGVQPNLNLGIIKQTPMPIAPLAEQEIVVGEAERLLSMIEVLQRDIADGLRRSDMVRQAILKAAFAGKLVPQDSADQPASVLLERIREERGAIAQPASRKRPVARRRISTKGEPTMVKTRKDIPATHLRDIIRASNGGMAAEALWKASELDIDDFYKQLRDEVAAGHLREERDGHTSQIVCR